MIKQKLQKLIFESVSGLGFVQEFNKSDFSFEQIELTHPTNPLYGDYASNIAFKLAGKTQEGNFLGNVDWILKNVTRKNFEEIEPKEGLPVGRLSKEVQKAIGAESELVYLKPRIYGKVKGWWRFYLGHPEITLEFFLLLPLFINQPERIYEDKHHSGRYWFVNSFSHLSSLIVELEENQDKIEIITFFRVRERDLKKLEKILQLNQKTSDAGTAISPILAHPANRRGVAGCRFSGLHQKVKKYINTVQEKSQEDILSYEEKKFPQEIAQEIASHLQEKIKKINEIEKVEAVGGFINFYLSSRFFIKQMGEVLAKKENFGQSLAGRGKKVLIEFGQPNTHKLPHIGHFRSYVLGESLARLLEFAGFEVFRANYQGDVGLHVAKCLWAMNRGQRSEVRGQNLAERVTMLQEAYIAGNKAYEDNPPAKTEIDELNNKIYQKDPQVFDLWQKTRQWSVDYYEGLNKRLGTKYHRLYFESEAAEFGKKIVMENLGRVFTKSQGAIIFEGSKHGLHDRVFITAAGNPTYEAKDLSLIFLKAKDFNYDLSLISTATEQIEYFKVVYQAASLIDKKLAERFVHIPFGLVSLSGGKLSSREGQIVAVDELLENVRGSLIEIMKKKNYSQIQIDKVIEPITIGAAKHSLLKQAPVKNIIFDIQESVSIEGNAGPYLQYTYARAKSILRKENLSVEKGWTLQKPERDLLKVLYLFPEIVDEATQTYSPNLICNYLFDLAQKFNRFYEKEQVIGHKREGLRLKLVKSVSQVLKNGLFLLGIQTPERI